METPTPEQQHRMLVLACQCLAYVARHEKDPDAAGHTWPGQYAWLFEQTRIEDAIREGTWEPPAPSRRARRQKKEPKP